MEDRNFGLPVSLSEWPITTRWTRTYLMLSIESGRCYRLTKK